MSEGLYFIGIAPPEDIQKEISELKHEVANKFGSRHALNSPPHITLHMPFKWKDKRRHELLKAMQEINCVTKPIEIELKDFGFFEPRVVFVSVAENEKLDKLQKAVVEIARKVLKLDNAVYKNQPFHPHVTIAFRDLKKKIFFEAKQYFRGRKFDEKFKVERVELFKHDGKKWYTEEIN